MGIIKYKSQKFIISVMILGIFILFIGLIGSFIIDKFFIDHSPKGQYENGYRIDKEPIRISFPDLGDFDKCYRKSGKDGSDPWYAVGPSSYWLKGFVFLNKNDFNIIKNQYIWIEMESKWKPSLDTNILKINSLKWYYCEEFNNVVVHTNFVGNTYIDLINGIIFFDVEG